MSGMEFLRKRRPAPPQTLRAYVVMVGHRNSSAGSWVTWESVTVMSDTPHRALDAALRPWRIRRDLRTAGIVIDRDRNGDTAITAQGDHTVLLAMHTEIDGMIRRSHTDPLVYIPWNQDDFRTQRNG